MKKPELLAPAGDFSKLCYAIEYGADAVYIGGEMFSLRTAAANFTPEEMERAVGYAHQRKVKVYVACNTVPRNEEIQRFPAYIHFLSDIGIDAVICADIGMFTMIRRECPDMAIHVSTQANICNYEDCLAWHELGASRVVLARELSLDDVRLIRSRCPDTLELEAFVHGAMCVSHSGRCLLSNFMAGRDANRGNCAQPCRWRYALVEEKRPGEYFPVEETDTGTFIFNSKDLCMIENIPDLCSAGIDSFKIEGRVKTEYYVSCITNAYRRGIDLCFDDLDLYQQKAPELYEEVCKVSHRQYYTGFYYGDQRSDSMNFSESSYIRDYELSAEVVGYETLNHVLIVKQKNKFTVGDRLELVQANKPPKSFTIQKMYDENGAEILAAPHAQMLVKIPYPEYVGSMSFLRRRKD